MPCPCGAPKRLYCVFPIWFTQCGRISFIYTMLCPCGAPKRLYCVFPIWFTHSGRVSFIHTMPCPCRAHAAPLRAYIVSFPFDLHTAAVFHSYIKYRTHAVLMPCLRSAPKSLYCVFPICFTQCGCFWFIHVMPCPYGVHKSLYSVFPISLTQCGRV